MRRLAFLGVLAACVAQAAEGTAMERSLTLPHPLEAGAIAFLVVHVGPLAPGQRIRVTTPAGEEIGTIAPFGPAQRRQSGVYSLPVPPGVLQQGALSVRVTVTQSNAAERAPTEAEVQSLELRAPGDAK